MIIQNENDLLQQLRPGIDGLILEDERHYATFLPSVWESVKNQEEFLYNLKVKAGFAPTHWSNTIQASRYTAEYIS